MQIMKVRMRRLLEETPLAQKKPECGTFFTSTSEKNFSQELIISDHAANHAKSRAMDFRCASAVEFSLSTPKSKNDSSSFVVDRAGAKHIASRTSSNRFTSHPLVCFEYDARHLRLLVHAKKV